MRFLARTAFFLLAGGVLASQDAVVPVPANVRAEGLPPIPASIAAKLAPYGQFRRAVLLSWHPSKRAMLVTATTASTPQVHSVDAPATTPRPVTSVADGVTGTASYSPAGG